MRLCGVDEAGRGPLVGAVVAAAVVFRDTPPVGLADSKALTARRREQLFEQILATCHVGIGQASPAEIDELNILQATLLAMRRAVHALDVPVDRILVDGNQNPRFEGYAPACVQTIVKGDALVAQISAASIVAKVTRDRQMFELDLKYPGYGFAKHSGYGVKAHLQALERMGPCPEHRRSFRPVAQALAQSSKP